MVPSAGAHGYRKCPKSRSEPVEFGAQYRTPQRLACRAISAAVELLNIFFGDEHWTAINQNVAAGGWLYESDESNEHADWLDVEECAIGDWLIEQSMQWSAHIVLYMPTIDYFKESIWCLRTSEATTKYNERHVG